MRWIRNKILCALLEVVYFIIQVANMFLTDIVLYEVNEGIKFDWTSLLKSPIFWIVVVIQILHIVLTSAMQKVEKKIDEEVIDAINKSEVEILDYATQSVKRGDFKSAKKALKTFDYIEKKRR